jgi:hypothetical protein
MTAVGVFGMSLTRAAATIRDGFLLVRSKPRRPASEEIGRELISNAIKRRWALHALLLLRYRVRGMGFCALVSPIPSCGLPLDKTPPKGYSADRIGQGAYGSSPNTATLFDVPT